MRLSRLANEADRGKGDEGRDGCDADWDTHTAARSASHRRQLARLYGSFRHFPSGPTISKRGDEAETPAIYEAIRDAAEWFIDEDTDRSTPDCQ